MAVEILKKIFKDRGRIIPPLEERVDKLIAEADTAEIYGNNEFAKLLHIEAATAARTVYEAIPTNDITALGRLSRARHAEVTVTHFISGGAIDDARNFAERTLFDPMLPEITITRIRHALKELDN